MSSRIPHTVARLGSFRKSARAAVLCAFALACGESNPAAPPSPANVNQYMASLPTWAAYLPPVEDADEATGAPSDVVVESQQTPDDTGVLQPTDYECTTTPYSLTRTPREVVTLDPDVEILYVGSLLQGEGHLAGIGSLAELPIRQRDPLTLSIDLLTGENTETVDNPTLATVNAAIGGLIQAAQSEGHTAGSDIFFTKETTHSFVQASLSLGLSANYIGGSLKSTLSADISDETRTVTAYFVQSMFNVSMVLPQTPEEVFSDAFTEELLQAEIDRGRIGGDNLPVYISNISYGRILVFSFTSTASLSDINGTVNALYNSGVYGGGVDLEAGLQTVLDEAQIKVVTVGGDATAALALIKGNDLGAYFAEDAPLTTARPISYTVRNLGDNTIAGVHETTDYSLKTCVAASIPATGSEYTFQFTSAKVISLPFIDSCGILVVRPNDCFDIELGYTINATTPLDGVVQLRNVTSNLQNPNRFRSGDEFALPSSVRIPDQAGNQTVELHYDRALYPDENIRIWGEARDWDAANASDRLPFSRSFSGELDPGPYSVTAQDNWGNKVRFYFTITKGADIFD